jgi:hypothetical protein
MGEIELDVWKDVDYAAAVLSKGLKDARDISLNCRSSVTVCCDIPQMTIQSPREVFSF